VIAIDTNVLVRVVTNDDPNQARRALRLMGSDRIFISRTVLLEAAWVLRHAYGVDDAAIGRTFATLAGVGSVDIEGRSDVLRALAWHAGGMDFADALHLAASGSAASFASFDRALGKRASKLGAHPPVVQP
jgi:predicted nucleic-acid-binding protein